MGLRPRLHGTGAGHGGQAPLHPHLGLRTRRVPHGEESRTGHTQRLSRGSAQVAAKVGEGRASAEAVREGEGDCCCSYGSFCFVGNERELVGNARGRDEVQEAAKAAALVEEDDYCGAGGCEAQGIPEAEQGGGV
ncbi:hypothetical protein V495_07952 [Pseudogymnoascus sp. VKM F-4514 (FW-929)]|nr:hypothetical protein V495_07952 [Pseudogymnoascus sp. VKM F-4514 (FW-929)]